MLLLLSQLAAGTMTILPPAATAALPRPARLDDVGDDADDEEGADHTDDHQDSRQRAVAAISTQ